MFADTRLYAPAALPMSGGAPLPPKNPINDKLTLVLWREEVGVTLPPPAEGSLTFHHNHVGVGCFTKTLTIYDLAHPCGIVT